MFTRILNLHFFNLCLKQGRSRLFKSKNVSTTYLFGFTWDQDLAARFLSAMNLRRTSKDLNSCPPPSFFIETKSWHTIVNKEFLPKNSSQKKSSQKNPPKKFLPENYSNKNSPEKFPKKIQKIPKQFMKKFLRFWKYPIPYIALRGEN